MTLRLLSAAALLLLVSCSDSLTGGDPPPVTSPRGVYVVNEGNFNQGNATLSYYDPATGTVTGDVFSAVNGRDLGDVANAIAVRGTRAYVIVNNSNRIEIIETGTHRSAGTIDMGAGRSPRQMVFLNDSIALVTNLLDDSVIPVDVKNRVLLPRIPVGANPEGIAIAAGKAFVANSGFGSGNTLSVISLGTLTAAGTITVGDNPADVQVTDDGLLYVLCAGGFAPETPAAIFVVRPDVETVVDTIPLPGHPYEFAQGPGRTAYVPVPDSVMVLDTRTHEHTGVLARGASYYAVGVDPGTGDVYLSDPLTFLQPGTIRVFTPAGVQKAMFTAGVIPGAFGFVR
jgi:hypothetical protein